MIKTELNAFRRFFESRQTELVNGKKSRQVLAIETSPDELDRIQHVSDRDCAMWNLERNSNGLRKMRTALHRIDAGTFGICVGCEENINSKRGLAVSLASSHIVCQEAPEKNLRSKYCTSLVMAA